MTLKMKNTTVHIKKTPIQLNQKLEFHAVDSLNELKVTKLSDLKGKKIISSVPSIDTPTCALQTVKFNNEIAKNYSDYLVITISKDLPFAQTRFCQSLKLNDNFYIWSDYRNEANNFAIATNLIIDELQLLARAIMILDEDNKVLYQQIVNQVGSEPDYDDVVAFIKQIEKK